MRGIRGARRRVGRTLFVIVILVALAGCATWQISPTETDIRAVHAALLPTGKVLLIEGSGGSRTQFAAGTFRSGIWDPVDGSVREIDTPYDMFCAGHAFLPDGRLLIVGGTAEYAEPGSFFPRGSSEAYAFNPWTEMYEPLPSMGKGRWYPTSVVLPDGAVANIGGIDERRWPTWTYEIFRADGTWSDVLGLPSSVAISYPTMHLLAAQPSTTGHVRLFYSGGYYGHSPSAEPGIWDLTDGTYTPVPGLRDPAIRDQAASVLLPPAQDQRVAIIGGGLTLTSESTDKVDIVELDVANPAYEPAPSISEPKMYVLAVTLPDRTVIQTGGTDRAITSPDFHFSHTAQQFNPATNAWTDLPDSETGRAYHSEALLLPDGRVAVFGGTTSSPPTEGIGDWETRIEVLAPPYMQKMRPHIDAGPAEISYGTSFQLDVSHPNGWPVQHVELVRPSAATHSTDPDQRLVDLDFSVEGSTVTAVPNFDGSLAPPGWYMAFVVDDHGVPSVAHWVHLS